MPVPAPAKASINNDLISALTGEEYRHLQPHLETVYLPPGEILYQSGERIQYAYFPLNSVIFLLAMMEDGSTAEVGMVGREGMLGIPTLMGAETTPNQAAVLVAKQALRMKAEVLKREFDRGGALQTLLLRYMQALFVQVTQTAACNRVHRMEGRLCRWLLMMHDRMNDDELPLTQEFIAQMLGTRRPYVTVAAGLLHKEGVISCRRGHIKILDRRELESRACECYGIVKEEFNRLLPGAHTG